MKMRFFRESILLLCRAAGSRREPAIYEHHSGTGAPSKTPVRVLAASNRNLEFLCVVMNERAIIELSDRPENRLSPTPSGYEIWVAGDGRDRWRVWSVAVRMRAPSPPRSPTGRGLPSDCGPRFLPSLQVLLALLFRVTSLAGFPIHFGRYS